MFVPRKEEPNIIGDSLPRRAGEGTGMTRATLRLSLPEAVWIGDFSRSHPAARLRILAALSDDDAGVALAEIRTDDSAAVVERMRDYDAVADVRVLRQGDDAALVQFETTLPLLLSAARDSGVPLEMPFDIVDGRAVWTLTAPRARLSALCNQLEALGVSYEVARVGAEEPAEFLLTDRQASLLAEAEARGYYDTPRRCTLTELAEAVGCAKSTVSEILHRAEGAVIGEFLADRAPDSPESPGRARTSSAPAVRPAGPSSQP